MKRKGRGGKCNAEDAEYSQAHEDAKKFRRLNRRDWGEFEIVEYNASLTAKDAEENATQRTQSIRKLMRRR
jgi:hypothetical protein